MAEIVPAILTNSFREIRDDLDMVAGRVHAVQIDVCDGGYVPTKTWPYSTGKGDIDFDALVGQEVGLPHWEEIDFEFDLMVRNVYEKIPDFVAIGATSIVIHRESVNDDEIEKILADYGKDSDALSDFGIALGLAYPPDTTVVDDVAKHIDSIDFVQVMGIRKVGFQGQIFLPSAIDTVRALRERFPKLIISVDGGVSTENARDLIDAGADKLIIGSAIFNEHDSLDALNDFLSI
ncbi:MAG: hypothetical protein COV01_02515 [Candidatus Taylorbacteria bacterium CG10_big_fil_rev_8_21_14_0_10_41_48]|uniref:Ribulose-phosphate 3-epimerase n=1 Tax=Candidatus Taylorbacteria bacterium CG10_big_fil_rev_8_21_14_0_10_41_48 TaxID=1975024 RepID=A0A2M8LCL1_9BACT|nr:MAG: hypothetical protein COV01_02515 [Candidatus Taylorbacteria bacterium CG10_big_fil_rev_8_21_14_0_10_41_48]